MASGRTPLSQKGSGNYYFGQTVYLCLVYHSMMNTEIRRRIILPTQSCLSPTFSGNSEMTFARSKPDDERGRRCGRR